MTKHLKIIVFAFFCFYVSSVLQLYGKDVKSVDEMTFADKLRAEADRLSKTEMQSIFQFMGDDLFEGRTPGTRGGELAEKYVRSILKLFNIDPYGGGYLQPFNLLGFTTHSLKVNAGGRELHFNNDVLGTFMGKDDNFDIRGDAVFIGYGTRTALWDWDDYKDADVSGKFVIARVNDPGMFIDDIFEGKILTYFGRWTYHIEEARRKGARAILLIHTDESAGYGWNVVQNSWSGEEVYLESSLTGNMEFTGWMREEVLRNILDSKNISLEKLYSDSLKRDFKPVPLGFDIHISGNRSRRGIMNNNVVGFIPGRSDKSIVISAHIDHLGMIPGKEGDNILNGAIDNGTAVAAMMMTARILKKFQTDLHFSVIILAPNAEEANLLGSKYFVANCDRNKIIANINFESTPVWGKSGSLIGVGARFSTMEAMLKEIAAEEGVDYRYFSMSNQGFFFRSDQFPFAMADIPSLWISTGEDDDSGENLYRKFWQERYHTVKDEYDPEWRLDGMRQTIRYALLLIERINREQKAPAWSRKLTFPTFSD